MICGIHLKSLLDSFEEIDATGFGPYSGSYPVERPDVGYAEKEIGGFVADTGIDVHE